MFGLSYSWVGSCMHDFIHLKKYWFTVFQIFQTLIYFIHNIKKIFIKITSYLIDIMKVVLMSQTSTRSFQGSLDHFENHCLKWYSYILFTISQVSALPYLLIFLNQRQEIFSVNKETCYSEELQKAVNNLSNVFKHKLSACSPWARLCSRQQSSE